MLDTEDAARLAQLRRLAYGRGGALTQEQADELRELESRGRSAAVEQVVPDSPAPADADAQPDPDVAETAAAAALPSEEAEPESHGPTSEERPRSIRRHLIPALVAVAVLVLGGGIGWLLAARAAEAGPAMTAAQSETWADLEAEGDYDPGSVRLVGSKYDASLWQATQDDGKYSCVILTQAERSSFQCLDPAVDHFGSGLTTQLDFVEDDTYTYLWGSLGTDLNGRPFGAIDRQQSDGDGLMYDWRQGFSEAELAEADQLVEAGHNGEMLSVVGYDDDRPVWVTQDEKYCVIVFVDGEKHENCADGYPAGGDVLELMIDETVYQVRMTDNRGPVLTIVRIPEPVVCAEGAPDDSTTQTCALTFDKEKWD